MNRETAIVSVEDLFGYCSNQDFVQNTADNFETYLELPAEVGRGFINIITPRPGIFVEIGNYRIHEDIAVSFKQTQCTVIFGFSITGSLKYELSSNKGMEEYWCYKQGHCVIGYLPKDMKNIFKFSVGPQTYYVIIAIDPLLLKTLLDGQYWQMPIGLRDIIDGEEEKHFCQTSVMPPVDNVAIRQIISCPYQASLKRLFLEGKVLEMISHSLARFASSSEPFQKNAEFRPVEIDRVLEARDILISNLEKPPSLVSLAKQVGTNKTTLNKGFRQIFGASVFEYLRISRLELAKKLLSRKEMNVFEVATYVGYSQQSSFTRAFKNYFGAIPTDIYN